MAKTPEALLSFVLDRLTPNDFATIDNALLDYARAGITWSGSDDQIATKAAGLVATRGRIGRYQLGETSTRHRAPRESGTCPSITS